MAVSNLPEEMYFYLSNGDKLTSLHDLISFLKKDLTTVFENHVNSQKNDFYNWVKFALKDESSAEKIKSAKTASEMLNRLTKEHHIEEDNQASYSQSKSLKISEDNSNKQSLNKQSLTRQFKKNGAKLSKQTKSKTRVPDNGKKVKKIKTKHERSYSPDFDYSLDLDEQRDALAQIRKRIEEMDLGLKSYSSDNTKESQKSGSVKSHLSGKNDKKDYLSNSFDSLDDKYPELSHKSINEEELKELKGSKPKKKLHHHIKSASSHVSSRVSHHAKRVHGYVSEKIEDAKKQAKIKKLVSSDKPKSKVSNNHEVESTKENTEKKISYEMEKFYGKPIDDSDEKRKPKKKAGIFGSILGKFKKAESSIAKDLPDLHEFEHAKKAQEFLTSDSLIRQNYHLHGVQDFFKGLIIGIVIGMLFLAIF